MRNTKSGGGDPFEQGQQQQDDSAFEDEPFGSGGGGPPTHLNDPGYINNQSRAMSLDPSQYGEEETMPDVLHLLLLCANATAPSDSSEEARTEAEESWEPVREWLRNHTGDEVRQAAEQRDDSSRTALHLACRNQPPIDVIHVFLSVALETVEWADIFGWLPLHYASAYLTDLEVIKALMESFPAAKTTVDSRGRTPLHLVLGNGNRNNELLAAHDVVAILSSSGAATHADYNGMLPLHYSCAYGASGEALYVLTGAHNEGIRARDRNSRTPLHFALSNAGNESSPTAVQHLLELDPDLSNSNGGSLPLRVLAGFAHKFQPSGDSTRESVQKCLLHLLNANPNPTPDFFTALQSLPVWLSERAVVMPKVQTLLNEKLSQRFPTAILMADITLILLIYVYYFINVTESIKLRFSDDGGEDVRISTSMLSPLFAGIAYFILREMIQIISFISMNAFYIWFYDPSSWLNVVFVTLVCFWTVMMSTGGLDKDSFRHGTSITVFLLWLKITIFLKQTVQNFAVFWGALTYILQRLVVFVIAMVIFLIAFTQMFRTEKMYTEDYKCWCMDDTPEFPLSAAPSQAPSAAPTIKNTTAAITKPCKGEDESFPYCHFPETFLHMLTMLLGEVDDTEFNSAHIDTLFFLIFMVLMVVIFATVLIAIVTDSYKIIQTQRSAIVFWTNRLHFVAQVDAVSRGFQNERVRKYLGGDQSKLHAEHVRVNITFGKEFWKNLMDLFQDPVEGGIFSVDFWVINLLRFFAAILIIPAWFILGLFSLGWLWPPQLRQKFCTAPVSKYAEVGENELRKTQVLLLGNEVKALSDEITHEITLDRIQVVQMKTTIADKRTEIANEMRHIKRIMTMLFDQQAQQ